MKRLSIIFAVTLVLGFGFFAFADSPLPGGDDESFYPAYTAANPTMTSNAGEIGGTQDMIGEELVPVMVDLTPQNYVDK